MKAKKPTAAENFAKSSAITQESGGKYEDAITVRMTPEMARIIRAIAYYRRESQRETIENAMDALLKSMDPNDIKEALKMYDAHVNR